MDEIELDHAELGADRCRHEPRCPEATHPAWCAATPIATWPEQGWSLLCNRVILFGDGGAIMPDNRAVSPPAPQVSVVAVRR